MNKYRRATLNQIKGAVESMEARLEELNEQLQEVMGEEEDVFEALPESLQGSEKGEKMTSAIDAMEQAIADLDDAKDRMADLLTVIGETLADVVSSLEVAVE